MSAVTLDRKGERININARFVVGCDGAHSTVRHAMNLPFEGAEYEDSFMLADIETNDALPADEIQLCPSELGPVAIFPMSSTRRRIVAAVNAPDHEGEGPSPNAPSCHAAPSPDAPSLDLRSGRSWRNARPLALKRYPCTGAPIFESITASVPACKLDACSSPATRPIFTARSAARE